MRKTDIHPSLQATVVPIHGWGGCYAVVPHPVPATIKLPECAALFRMAARELEVIARILRRCPYEVLLLRALNRREAVASSQIEGSRTSFDDLLLYAGSRTRLRGAAEIDLEIKLIVDKYAVGSYLKVRRTVREEHLFKQTRRGRPGPETAYRKVTKRRFDIEWRTDEEAIAFDHKSDGMYPLMTNDRRLSSAEVLEAHKGQPMIEQRFEQIKTVHEIAPVFLKN